MTDVLATAMLETEAIKLIANYAIRYPPHRLATNLKQALDAADAIGYPIVIKVVSPDILHKSEVGGVIAGITNSSGLRKAYSTLKTCLRLRAPMARIQGILVCQQAPDGLEAMVGVKQDPAFGPVVLFGLGGIFAEALRDTTLRIAQLDRKEAIEMIHEIRASPVLAGARGRPAIDENALVELLLSISRLAIEHPEIAELDLNPVRLYSRGILVLDVRIMVSEMRF
jgi:acyl-CoA synthetase (NDP forming)